MRILPGLTTIAMMILGFAQGVAVRTLALPASEVEHEFTDLSAVRELPDGRVIVIDRREELLAVTDFRDGTLRRVGRVGSGPAEYRAPTSLLLLPAGATALPDGANGRVLRIDAQAALGTLSDEITARIRASRWIDPYASDTLGRFYRPAEPVRIFEDGRSALTDSFAIERFDLATGKLDSAAFVRITDGLLRTLEPGTTRVRVQPRSRIRAFASSDQWAVAPDGRVAVLSSDPFRVTYFEQGRRIDGPVLPFQRIAVTARDKEAWLAARRKPQQVVIQRGRDGPKSRVMGPPPRANAPVDFPEFLPPFVDGALRFAPDGRLWIQRATSADSLLRYDVIDQRGHLVQRVTLARRLRVVGFGSTSIYVVRTDEDDLQYLQRYEF